MRKESLLITLFLIAVILLMAVFLPKEVFSEKIFTIKSGQGLKEISLNLKESNLIYSDKFFQCYVFLTGQAKNIKAGTYAFIGPTSLFDLTGKIVKGKTANEKITFPEGYTAEKIYQKIAEITQVNLANLQENEGYLFPDTYLILYGATSQDIIKMMTENFDKKTAGLEFSEDDIIMASILEKEVRTKEEKELVSGLLWKRLRAGMPLQVDSAPETYQVRGLPQKPICNPGLESIEAALNPKASLYWYYLSTPEGQTIFSKTFDEHDTARAKYLR